MNRLRAFAAGILLMIPAVAGAQATSWRLPPPDECRFEPSLVQFRAELAAAVKARSKERLLALLADNIRIDFASRGGREAFAAAWKLGQPAGNLLWAELDEILRLGCGLNGATAHAPALFGDLGSERDAEDLVLAVKPGAAMLAAPRDGSRVVSRLKWDVLRIGEWDGIVGWLPVTMADGRSGYVRRDQVRGPLDHRAIFAKVGGRWRITAFVAGD